MAQIKKVKKARSTTPPVSESPDIPVVVPDEEEIEDRIEVDTEDGEDAEGDQDQADEGDDTSESAVEPAQPVAEEPWLADPKCPRDAIVVGPGAPIRVTGVFVNEKQIRTDCRVLRANRVPRAKGWYFTLIYGKNALVPVSLVETVNGKEIHAANPIRTLKLDQAVFPATTTSDGFSLPRSA